MAEGATHVDMFHDIRKPAFTLAEVLVTLGIIGIVAAMTLPMLAKNYQFYVRQQQFKKAYAALNIAVQKAQIDMGEGVRCYSGENTYANDCDMFYSELVKNLQVIKTCEGNALEERCISKDFRGGEVVYAETQGGDDPEAAKEYYNKNCYNFKTSVIQTKSTVYIFNSGFSILPYYHHSLMKYPIFLLDVNGLQGPNKWGHDVFVFELTKRKPLDSVFYLDHMSGCHALDFGGIYTKHIFNYLYGVNQE